MTLVPMVFKEAPRDPTKNERLFCTPVGFAPHVLALQQLENAGIDGCDPSLKKLLPGTRVLLFCPLDG